MRSIYVAVSSMVAISALDLLLLLLVRTQAHHRAFQATAVHVASVAVPVLCAAVATWAVIVATRNAPQDVAARSRVFATTAATSAIVTGATFVALVPWLQTVLHL
jgi:hypothetical protein